MSSGTEAITRAQETVFDDLDRLEALQDDLGRQDVAVPLEHRASWLREVASDTDHWLAAIVPARSSSALAAVPVQHAASRALPDHPRLRVSRFGYGTIEGVEALVAALKELAEGRERVLSLNLEVFTSDPTRRGAVAEMARASGFERVEMPRRYRHTARLDLTRDEDRIFAGFSRSCRRDVRAPKKKGFRILPVQDERWAPRMERLWDETFSRTGAAPPPRAWRDRIAYGCNHPDLFRIVGTFSPDYPEVDSLVSFVCAMNNGDHAVYSDSGSTQTLDSPVAISYAPLWESMKWAKSQGCEWFDMGGITSGTLEDADDPRGGISDFKRRFTEEVIEVGGEWTFTPRPFREALAHGAHKAASGVRRVIRRFRTEPG